jgi:hypothetical protein
MRSGGLSGYHAGEREHQRPAYAKMCKKQFAELRIDNAFLALPKALHFSA